MSNSPRSSNRLLPPWLNGRWGVVGIGAFGYLLVYLLWLRFHWGGEDNVMLIGDLFYLPMDFIVALASLLVSFKKDLAAPIRRMWLILGLGFASYLVGDLIWTYLENVLESPPFPSIADLFYLLFPLLASVGLFSYSNIPLEREDRWKYSSDLVTILITASMLMWYFIIEPTAAANAGGFLPQAIATAYPIMDVVLMGGIIGILLRKAGDDARPALRLLFFGMLFFISADILYAYTGLAGTYTTGSWIDAGWLIGQLLFLLTAIRQMRHSPETASSEAEQNPVDTLIRYIPNVAAAAATLVTIFVVAINFNPRAGWLLSGAGLSVALVFLREYYQFSYRTKFVTVFALSSTLLAFFIGIYYYNAQAERSLEDFRKTARTSIAIAALQQNGDEFEEISSAEDPLYEKFRIQNLKIRYSNDDFIFLYTMRKDAQGIYFVVDAGEPGEENIAPYGEPYTNPSPLLLANFDTLTEPIADADIYTDEYGSFLSAYAPIFNSSGTRVGVIAVDIDANTIRESQNQYLVQTLVLILIAGGASILIGWYFGSLLVNPILQLTEDTTKYVEGNLSFRTVINTNDEVGKLGVAFNTMAGQIQEVVSGLETEVASRTTDLIHANREISQRSKKFEAVAQVARSISATQNLDTLLSQITDLISHEFGFYHVGIFLLDSRREYAVLSAANSEGGQKMLERAHRLRVGETGLVGFVTSTGRARVALDTGMDAVYFDNPDLPQTRSEIALSLRTGEGIIGALDVQSDQPNAFGAEDVNILSTLADQMSVAIQNAKQFEATRRALNESEALSRQFVQTGWQQFGKSQTILGIRHSGAKSTLLYRKGRKGKGGEPAASSREQTRPRARGVSLSLPVKLRGEVIGSVDVRSAANRRFDQDELDIVNAILERAAIAMENARLLADSQKRAAKERAIGEITAKISARSEIEDLLKTAAQELNRTLPGTEIAIQLNKDQEKRHA